MKPDNNPTIIFFTPGRDKYPIGGYKIVYEYANRFAAEGYPVSILYPYRSAISLWKEFLLKRRIKDFIRFLEYIKNSLFHSHKAGTWFPLNPMIKKHFCFRVTEKVFKNYSENTRIIATALRTSFELNSIKKFPESQKYYFVQDFENWGVTADTVYSSYSLSLTKITIAPWLQEKIKTSGNSSYLVYNGFDFNHFRLTNPIDSRSPYEIAALYHMSSVKRWSDVFSALQIVKETIPELHVTLFGTPEQPDLPEWCSYFRCPDKQTHNQIYNNASIFVAASDYEGFGLTVGESMICGCAVACTDNGGFSCMVHHNQTGLLSPIYDTKTLAENIIKLINDHELRIRLAKAGNEYIRQFTWERAYSQFKEILQV